MGTQLNTKKLTGMRAVDARNGKRIGKVRRFVFHPSERRLIGVLIKRPDAALMFHRKDLFVSLKGCHIEEGELVVHDEPGATDKSAIKALGVNWDACVIWVGMPVITASGEFLGFVESVAFDAQTGAVASIKIENGAANDAVLGKRVIPGKLIKGYNRSFKTRAAAGQTDAAPRNDEGAPNDGHDGAGQNALDNGAILVANEAASISVEGGVAEAAGKATAVAADKAKKGARKARKAANQRIQQAKPTAQEAAQKTGEAIDAGVFAVGKQLGKATGMFSAFKEEFEKASRGEDEA